MKLIKNILMWGILLVSLGLLYYVNSIKYVACETPLQYTIGNIDQKFGIDETKLRNFVEEASEVWEDRTQLNLFTYFSEDQNKSDLKKFLERYIDRYYVRSPIVINLIYDERQVLADKNRQLASKIDTTRASAEEIKKDFLELQGQYDSAKAEYESMLESYSRDNGNRQKVENKRLEVNGLVDQINSLVAKYNFLVKEVNTNVEVVNSYAGTEYEEGEYISDRTGERINIYEFENERELLKVLTHELGHALGLEHNENSKSVMYYLNQDSNIYLTEEDLVSLRQICKEK